MKTFFVGIDISKDWLDVAICKSTCADFLDSFRVENSVEGIKKMIIRSKRSDRRAQPWFCFEHTGNYGLLLCHLLEQHDCDYSAVAAIEIKKSIGMTRGKNDVIDAKRIAQYAAINHFRLQKTKLPGGSILKIKSLLVHRDQIVKLSTQLKNSLKSSLIVQKSIDISDIIIRTKKRIDDFQKDIMQIEKQIISTINEDIQLKETFNKSTTVKGIGPIIAATMLVVTHNFTRFQDARKFNCYAGLAPFEHSSGSSITGKSRTHPYRNKNVKRLLFNGANTAANFDLEIKAYYKRKKEQGKHHMTIMNAIACKLVARVFAVIKRNEPFVNLVR
jgi:transposase